MSQQIAMCFTYVELQLDQDDQAVHDRGTPIWHDARTVLFVPAHEPHVPAHWRVLTDQPGPHVTLQAEKSDQDDHVRGSRTEMR